MDLKSVNICTPELTTWTMKKTQTTTELLNAISARETNGGKVGYRLNGSTRTPGSLATEKRIFCIRDAL
jgi:hypothetical protein